MPKPSSEITGQIALKLHARIQGFQTSDTWGFFFNINKFSILFTIEWY